jgi:class 3 adenylate cyclase/tetratricopeptide (TPR) repeat protein
MKCPKCQFENPEGAKFCIECGQTLEAKEGIKKVEPSLEGERKQVSALFSDLSGYTAMSERLDPEEVKEIMSQIFGKITSVVNKYDGTIEKFIGDAVVAFFGVPKAHEDDPVRAIRAAREINKVVDFVSPQFESKVGKPLAMHTGINTGLVVTGEVILEKGTVGVTGDTVNLASRLSGLAKPGEILVGQETFRQAEGYFDFERLEPIRVEGKTEAVRIYKVLSLKEETTKIHRLSGMRADLIGRKGEMATLGEAIDKLREGKGSILSVSGEAGTGKTRLIEDFKATLDLQNIQWREGHAYAYSQNIPYFPLIDLFNRAWRIEEGFAPEKVRERVESGINAIGVKQETVKNVIPYVGSLYSLSYPEIESVSPEYWKTHLQEAVQTVFEAFVQRKPTVICLEDLHWADPSSIDLIYFILSKLRYPALFLFVYRPPFNLLPSRLLSEIGERYREIRLQDLSMSEAYDMVESLLKTKAIPTELKKFVQEKIEGNPFYLEEVMNALIETGTLIRDNGSWKLARPITESNVPSTIQGVISARVDRLEKESKQVLQEASVIGRAFIHNLLLRITELKDPIERCLDDLKSLDLIRIRSLQPELEYIFKHALTQEVVYSGLLKKERQAIHERIALAMEQLFYNRLPEFYETLAFHFKQGQSIRKAINYLVKSGEKSLNRYAAEESHQYFKEAFDLLSAKPNKTKDEEFLLIDILVKWAYAFWFRGFYRELLGLLSAHQGIAESLDDKARLGMFYGWLGHALWGTERYRDSYQYLYKALKLGEDIKSQQIIGFACSILTWVCAEIGLLDDAIAFGERAREMFMPMLLDDLVYFESLGGMGEAYWHRGDCKKALEVGKALLDFGQKYSNIRSLVYGQFVMGWAHFTAGDLSSAIKCFQSAVQVSADPYFSQFPRLGLIYSYVASSRFDEAEEPLQEVLAFSEKFDVGVLKTPAQALQGLLLIAKGHLSKGIKKFQEVQRIWLKRERKCLYAASEYMIGGVYLMLSRGGGKFVLPMIIKNIGFLLKTIPVAKKKAEEHFLNSINVAREIGAKNTLGRAYLDLGLLYKLKGKKDKSKECLSKAIQIFEQTEAEWFLKQAEEALVSLKGKK